MVQNPKFSFVLFKELSNSPQRGGGGNTVSPLHAAPIVRNPNRTSHTPLPSLEQLIYYISLFTFNLRNGSRVRGIEKENHHQGREIKVKGEVSELEEEKFVGDNLTIHWLRYLIFKACPSEFSHVTLANTSQLIENKERKHTSI